MDTLARDYIRLAHAIEAHAPGFIDGYYGPPELADVTLRPLDDLAREADALLAAIATEGDAHRRDFLAAQGRAMQARIALLRGEPMPYDEEVRRLYDIEMPRTDEAEFDAAIAALDALLPDGGSIPDRDLAFRRRFELDPDRLPSLLDVIVKELRQRTLDRYGLPEGESFEIQMVKNEPWGAYNWYLGNYQSRIDINTDLPSRLIGLPDLVAHEGYPGHHTEHALKEARLLREQGHGEHSILLINAPECVISEGIATRALSRVMDEAEVAAWLADELLPLSGLAVSRDEVAAMLQIGKAKQSFAAVPGNAARLLHIEGANHDEVVAYLQRYRLSTEEEARKMIQFLTHPTFRSYTYTYTVGGQLLDDLFAARGDADRWFARLLTEATTPSMVRAWMTGEL